MTAESTRGSPAGDAAFQAEMLQRVSRTFALTIPQLPEPLRAVVANAYLLCRIADAIEDEPALALPQKRAFAGRFAALVAGRGDAAAFAADLAPLLSSDTPPPERELVAHTARVVRMTGGFRSAQRRAIERCIRIMSQGMVEFQQDAGSVGLKDMPQLDRYCYVVAGVVAEMLAELFCDHAPEIEARRDELFRFAVAYGQGLQMTNILKDVWDDWSHGACWLPRDVFRNAGFELRALGSRDAHPGFARGFSELVGVARGHLADGLRFILAVPEGQSGIRRHLLWTLGLSVLVLRRLAGSPEFLAGGPVRPSRWSIRAMLAVTSGLARYDSALRLLFRAATHPLPAPPSETV